MDKRATMVGLVLLFFGWAATLVFAPMSIAHAYEDRTNTGGGNMTSSSSTKYNTGPIDAANGILMVVGAAITGLSFMACDRRLDD